MTFVAHFHGGPRDGTSRELDVTDPELDHYLDEDEEAELMKEMPIEPVQPGEPYPVIPDSHYVLRDGSIADGLHYDWRP
jgi:hypothetical protein